MKTKTLTQIYGKKRHVFGDGFESLRYLLERDQMGFSLHLTKIPAGTTKTWHYKHHKEACFCIKGLAKVYSDGKEHTIKPYSMYALEKGDEHTFTAIEDVELISVFNPPVEGDEIHQADNSYRKSEAQRIKATKILKVVKESDNGYDALYEIEELL